MRTGSPRLVIFEQFSASLPSILTLTIMERFAELILRFLEIQNDGTAKSPELIAEDERLMDGLQERYRAFVLASRG